MAALAAPPKPQDIARGMLDLPLSPVGEMQADHLGRRVAAKGGVDTVVSSSRKRSMQTAQAILAHNPQAHYLGPDAGSDPLHQGALEGHPSEAVRPAMEHYAQHPEQKIEGVGASGVQGESVNEHSARAGDFVKRQLHSLRPGERRLVAGHHSLIRYLHGWARKGFPPDMSIEPGEMASRKDKAAPAGEILRLAKKGGKPTIESNPLDSDAPIKPGLNFTRHGATPGNKESGETGMLARLRKEEKGPTLS